MIELSGINGGLIMSNFDAVLFDFDGTVADTGEGVFLCVRHAIEVHGLKQPSDSEIRRFIGPPMIVSYRTLYPQLCDDEIQSLMQSYREKYAEVGLYKYKLYDGITELLRKLNEAGIKTAVASSKPQEALTNIIKVSGIDKYFDCIVGADKNYTDSDKATIIEEAIRRTGVTDRSRVLMVGDRKYDVIGAEKCGVDCVGVRFGYAEPGELEAAGAVYVAEDADDLFDYLTK